MSSSSSEDEDDEDQIEYASTDNEESNEEDAECPICNKMYSEDKEGQKWIRCTKCFVWSHEKCNGKVTKTFICIICVKKIRQD